ncbi:SDR family oxidoreductase [Amycolatopsis sp. NPDC088138]|uniref:SDR family oxidoreductase n=1 Tax=Amycolatopsis sp. NPDC088138 TaxID=3363938 RepID=UPI003810549E
MSIALVAGGTSGIGLATARRLHTRGYDVHITGRGKERLDDVAASDPHLTGHRADGGDAAAMAALAESLGTVDVLVVSLSGAEGMGPIAELDLAMLRRAFDAKFWAHLTTIQAVLPHLAADGSITLLGAISARASMPGTAGIGALNAAVEALVRPLAVELAPRRVNAVSPGVVDTAWWSGFPDEMRAGFFAQTAAQVPVRRVATADDVAEVVALAATNANLSGTVLEADGGAHLVSVG